MVLVSAKILFVAADYFKKRQTKTWRPAQTYLGRLYLDQGDISTATRYFDLAARNGHIEAFYHLAEISNNGIGRERSCGIATAYYKLVAEKAEPLHPLFMKQIAPTRRAIAKQLWSTT